MYDNGRPSSSSSRSTLLTVVFGMMVAAGVFAFGLMVMGLFFLQALGIVIVIAGFGLVHYWVWGSSLDREVEKERQADEVPPLLDEFPLQPPHHPRRF